MGRGTRYVGDVMRPMRCLILLLTISAGICLGQGSMKIISWGVETNDPAWNQAFHVTGAREGCSSPPDSCMKFAARLASTYGVKVFLSIPMDRSKVVGYATEYSRDSLNAPFLAEIGIDDFVGQYRKQSPNSSADPAFLAQIIDAAKSANPNLGFGITVYENELTMPALSDAGFPSSLRQKVNYVHFYLHYRKNADSYRDYIKQVRQMFPNAQVIGGIYAYDRIAYVPCRQGEKQQCGKDEEFALFKKALDTQIDMLRAGGLNWIELEPGHFGREEQWEAWNSARTCEAERKQECVDTTKKMRDAVSNALASHSR
jgi:hypothetical protein